MFNSFLHCPTVSSIHPVHCTACVAFVGATDVVVFWGATVVVVAFGGQSVNLLIYPGGHSLFRKRTHTLFVFIHASLPYSQMH